jgi:hypothetical protein
MDSSQMQKPQRARGEKATVDRLFLLDLRDDSVVSLNPDGSDRKVVVTECRYPDGIAVDAVAGHIYWSWRRAVHRSCDGWNHEPGLEFVRRIVINRRPDGS